MTKNKKTLDKLFGKSYNSVYSEKSENDKYCKY